MNDLSATTLPAAGGSQRAALMLRLWEAISAERELPGVLATLADVSYPVLSSSPAGEIG